MKNTCDACKSNHILTHREQDCFHYKGEALFYEVEYSICENCGEEFINADQIKRNDIRIREAKKVYDGLLSAKELKRIRRKLHLTQEEAATIFGGGPNSFSKYERGEVTQSQSMDRLLRLSNEDAKVVEKLKSFAS